MWDDILDWLSDNWQPIIWISIISFLVILIIGLGNCANKMYDERMIQINALQREFNLNIPTWTASSYKYLLIYKDKIFVMEEKSRTEDRLLQEVEVNWDDYTYNDFITKYYDIQ